MTGGHANPVYGTIVTHWSRGTTAALSKPLSPYENLDLKPMITNHVIIVGGSPVLIDGSLETRTPDPLIKSESRGDHHRSRRNNIRKKRDFVGIEVGGDQYCSVVIGSRLAATWEIPIFQEAPNY